MVSLSKRNTSYLARQIIANLNESYDLIYVDYRDQLNDAQKAALVKGDWDGLINDPDIEEWESASRYEGTKYVIDEAVKDVISTWEDEDGEFYSEIADDFDGSTDWDEVRYEIEGRGKGDWLEELVSHSGDVLLRINVLDEDHGYAFNDVQAEDVLADVGLPVTEANVKNMNSTLAECSPEFSVLLGYWIVGADLSDLYKLPYDCEQVEIVNPYLYLGNPFSGSGWISDDPFEGVVQVARKDLRTDKDAFGYSIDNIFGGVSPSSYQAEIRAITTGETS